jgi:hypothetical protein
MSLKTAASWDLAKMAPRPTKSRLQLLLSYIQHPAKLIISIDSAHPEMATLPDMRSHDELHPRNINYMSPEKFPCALISNTFTYFWTDTELHIQAEGQDQGGFVLRVPTHCDDPSR